MRSRCRRLSKGLDWPASRAVGFSAQHIYAHAWLWLGVEQRPANPWVCYGPCCCYVLCVYCALHLGLSQSSTAAYLAEHLHF